MHQILLSVHALDLTDILRRVVSLCHASGSTHHFRHYTLECIVYSCLLCRFFLLWLLPDRCWPLLWPVVGRDAFSPLAPNLGPV